MWKWDIRVEKEESQLLPHFIDKSQFGNNNSNKIIIIIEAGENFGRWWICTWPWWFHGCILILKLIELYTLKYVAFYMLKSSLKWIIDLNVKSRTKIPEDTEPSIFAILGRQRFLVQDTNSTDLQRKNWKIGLHPNFLLIKRHHWQKKKRHHWQT